MSITNKPGLTLFSRFRHKCLGVSFDRYNEMNDIVYVCLAYIYSRARHRKDGIFHVSNLIDLAWDKAQPSQEEVVALSFICGSLYDRASEFALHASLEAVAKEVTGAIGEELASSFDNFYSTAYQMIAAENKELQSRREQNRLDSENEVIVAGY